MRETKKLAQMFSQEYELITILPTWVNCSFAGAVGNYIDDVVWLRYRDILIDPERWYLTADSWLLSRKNDLEKIYSALLENYKPLENYSMIEKEGSIEKIAERETTSKRYGSEKTATTIPSTKSSRYTTTDNQTTEGRLESYTTAEATGTNPTVENTPAQLTVSTQEADNQGRQGVSTSTQYTDDVEIAAPTEGTLEGHSGSQRELTRAGNIGVTTSQQMLESELQLRVNYSFVNIFCEMFVKELTLGVYDLD